MPRPNNPLPDFLPTLHLYRHLIRECSYLPPAWRQTIVTTIRGRFRQHRKYDERETKHRAQAYQALGTLRLANGGHGHTMQKLMRKAFARSGPRRRALMSKFVLSDSPSDSDALEALLEESSTPKHAPEQPEPAAKLSKNAFHLKWDKDKIRQLARSQHRQEKANGNIWLNTDIRAREETQYVPKTNIWGKPPCESLVLTKLGRFWRTTAFKIMPPLEKHEWDQIGQLSKGAQDQTKEWMVPKRRQPAKQIADEQDTSESDWDWEGYARFGANYVDRQKAPKRSLRTGQQDAGPYQQLPSNRDLSPRWYRRTYMRLWQITPKMEQDPRSLKRNVTWGSPEKFVLPARKSQMEFLEGISEKDYPAMKRMISHGPPRVRAEKSDNASNNKAPNDKTPRETV